jgi:flagellar assembly protein FliH
MSDSFRIMTKDQIARARAEPGTARVVKTYEQKPIHEAGFMRERVPVVSDPRPAVKDSRFQVSDLARPYLPVHAEEQREVESRVRAQVDAIAQETYEAALARGLEEGREMGRRQAHDEVTAAAAPMLDRLAALGAEFEGIKASMYQANERFLTELVLRIARKVCLKEVAGDGEYIQRLARSMIEQSGARESIRVRLNPAQVDSIASLRADLAKSLGELRNLQIEVSADVPEGGCAVETDFSSMKASVDTQLDAIHDSMVKG